MTKFGPPAAAIFFASICAPARAGESNGFMSAVRSTAAPITTVGPLALLPAAVVAPIVVATATAASTATEAITNLSLRMCPPARGNPLWEYHLTTDRYAGSTPFGLALVHADRDLRVDDVPGVVRRRARRLPRRRRGRDRDPRIQA